ncbi:MAG TPA: protocatechuate 3,4-dioxygenase subunit alpha [Candidatus Binataceae bacterium]|nr:protocatechuate 3,4-dioxygenase subunit alpha [Candidatus Binataceae bacterium]
MGYRLTPSQTIGPFFHKALLREDGGDLADPAASGERIVIEGRVIDGDGAPVSDAMIEIWQANAAGRYDHPDDPRLKSRDPHFHGFGRIGTDSDGRFRFHTIKPGPVREDGDFIQAPHISLMIFARGLLRHLATRIYFPDETLNETDPVLCTVPPDRRGTLIAEVSRVGPKTHYRLDIFLQGSNETVFFDF